ncbi:universal stress protein [Flavobacterium sp. UMI-01]|uniref:universal stress protein n=1 Tax=Flavobacterium sp. UMI-01 TaxID=1441053 RepID=UPI001C7D7AB5|nr:universal stress protein [Flavobacterium sp. UMI-01]GIZ07340.1 universal stress protein UspA [Flavobacterium sp. UMI-01]
MKRILVPTDFSSQAENALKTAATIAKKTNAEIELLHMLEIPSQMNDAITGAAGIPEIMHFIKKANEILEETAQHPCLQDILVSKHVKFEKASEGILSFIKDHNTDLIVMGSKGISGIEEILIGSNTEKVVRHSDVPVLVVKNNDINFEEPHIVFASDFAEVIKTPFQKMIDFASIFNAKLSLVTICTPNSFKSTIVARKMTETFLTSFNLKHYTTHLYNDTNVEKGILNFSSEVGADIIALCTHGRTGLVHFFTGSISEDLVNHAVKPVISFKI